MQKVFMLIQRGITDRTPVCVFPWEQPILEEIHGVNASPITIDELCDLQGAKVKTVKPREREVEGKKVMVDEGPTMREQYEAMVEVDPESNPLNDPEAEFERLANTYGMHTQIKLANVEKVYGSMGGFRMAMRDYAKGKTPDFVGETGPIEAEEKPLAEMSTPELRTLLKGRGVDVPKRAGREVLEDLYHQPA